MRTFPRILTLSILLKLCVFYCCKDLVLCSSQFKSSVQLNSNVVDFARIALANYQHARYARNDSILPTIEEQVQDFLTDLKARKVQRMIQGPSNETDPFRLAFPEYENHDRECMSSSVIMKLLSAETIKQNLVDIITQLCPVILFHAEGDTRESCVSSEEENDESGTTALQAWGFGILSVVIISCCSLGGVLVLPFLGKTAYETCITVFEGLAVGSLLSSAIFHLLPEAFDLHLAFTTEEYLIRALIIFIGVYVFYLVEHLMRYFFALKKERKSKGDVYLKRYSVSKSDLVHSASVGQLSTGTSTPDIFYINSSTTISPTSKGVLPVMNEKHVEEPKKENNFSPKEAIGKQPIETIAWMIIFGDGFHNFIDGISVGASFTRSVLSGLSISLAIFCEEFPHELGDFAVLLSAGMSVKQAVIYNFLSACTCFLGLIVGILLGDLTSSSPLIFAFATGMFLYISLVDMMDEINTKLKEATEEGGVHKGFRIFLLQNFGIWLGFTLLFLLAYFADSINLENKK